MKKTKIVIVCFIMVLLAGCKNDTLSQKNHHAYFYMTDDGNSLIVYTDTKDQDTIGRIQISGRLYQEFIEKDLKNAAIADNVKNFFNYEIENTSGNDLDGFLDNRYSEFYSWGAYMEDEEYNDISFMVNFSFWSDEYILNKTNKELLKRYGIMEAYDESTDTFSLNKLKESSNFIFSYYFDFPVSEENNIQF